MKTPLPFSILLLLCISLASCQKTNGDYTCTCDIKTNGSTTPVNTTFVDVSADDAKTMCNDYGRSSAGSNSTYSCKTSLR